MFNSNDAKSNEQLAFKHFGKQIPDTVELIYDVVERNAMYNNAENDTESRIFWLKAVKKEAKRKKLKMSNRVKAFISIVVYKDGSIGEVKILRSSGDTKLDEFAIYCGENLKAWAPGKQRNIAVNTRINMPVYIE